MNTSRGRATEWRRLEPGRPALSNLEGEEGVAGLQHVQQLLGPRILQPAALLQRRQVRILQAAGGGRGGTHAAGKAGRLAEGGSGGGAGGT